MPFDGTNIPHKARVFHDALELLRRDGWCQHFGQINGRRCLVQAIHDIDREVYLDVMTEFTIAGPIVFWNDTPGRTFAEVEAWFEERIAEAMNDG